MVAMVCVMVVVLCGTIISSFASGSTYISNGTTRFFNRITIGGNKGKGKAFKAADKKAKLSFLVMPESRATQDKCHVYQVYVDADDREYVQAVGEFSRDISDNNGVVNKVDMEFTQKVGKKYKYVLSIPTVKYDKVTGYIDKWPDASEKKVKHEFVITSLSLDY